MDSTGDFSAMGAWVDAMTGEGASQACHEGQGGFSAMPASPQDARCGASAGNQAARHSASPLGGQYSMNAWAAPFAPAAPYNPFGQGSWDVSDALTNTTLDFGAA